MTHRLILLVIVSTLLLFSCKDDSVSPNSGKGFFVTITVKDSAGNPVQNLQVIGGNALSPPYFQSIPVETWANRAYYARIIVQDTVSGTVLFRDSVLTVFGDIDISNPPSLLGTTSSAGTVTIEDPSRLPGFLHLSQIPITTTDGPDTVGWFSIRDTAIIILRDPITNQQQRQKIVIKPGVNFISIVWSPPTASLPTIERRIFPGRSQQESQKAGDVPTQSLATTVIMFDLPYAAHITFTAVRMDGTVFSTLIDQTLWAGYYWVQFNISGDGINLQKQSSQQSTANPIPERWAIHQNFPNPFN